MKRLMKLWFILVLSLSFLFSANTMQVENTSTNTNTTFWVEISITNDDAFVAFECDLIAPSGFTYQNSAVLSGRKDDHTLTANSNADTVHILSYSPTSKPYSGSSGTVVSVQFSSGSSTGDFTFSLSDPIIGDASSQNILTGSSSGTVTVSEVPSPIKLRSFIAEKTSGGVRLTWETASETENSHFLIYRDGDVIGQVEGNGTTTEQHSYTYMDTRVQGGIHHYAIADVSYGGIEKLHDAVSVEVGEEIQETSFVLNKAYPNPFNPRTAISYQLSAANNIDLSIFDTNGNKVESLFNGEQAVGQYQVIWNAEGLPSGTYIAKMQVGDMIQTQKIVLVK